MHRQRDVIMQMAIREIILKIAGLDARGRN